MRQFKVFAQEEPLAGCAYCGEAYNTRDHVPSLVLLDEPLSANLPVVAACGDCNESFSSDEEYLACLIDVTITAVSMGRRPLRPKVQRAFEHSPALAALINGIVRANHRGIFWDQDDTRVANAVLKLARGHAAFELSCPQLEEADEVFVRPLTMMSQTERDAFERVALARVWPEVGSRAMQRMAEDWPDAIVRWVEVQTGRYRYLTTYESGVGVRMVLSEFLACEVWWS
jgi:hypothetical protein